MMENQENRESDAPFSAPPDSGKSADVHMPTGSRIDYMA
jgi:hypothetical protein